ncbi:MAG: helix-turn-helix transcriptional regulator [Firmicutes bacterium]|nr:helix-turn-helix transcriptional regulator [Alicyclobacillaceae bacterium]MCL6497851.1 helix-turn-helix transcriptional regulator [Bacillota bacterium]
MVGAKIRELRKKLGLTQEQLAGTELTKSYVSQVELGRISPSQKALQIMAARLGKPVGYFQENRDDLRTIDFLLKAARALWTTHRLEEGMLGLKEALSLAERIGREDLMAQIKLAMGRLEMAQGHLTEAEALLQHSLELSRNEARPELITEVADTLGLVATRLGNFQDAVHSFQLALESSAALSPEHTAIRVEALRDYGDFCHGLGQWESALALYREALTVAAAVEPRYQAELDARMANALAHRGAAQDAERHIAAAERQLDRRHEDVAQAIIAADLGKCLLLLHRYSEAYQRLREVLEVFEQAALGPEWVEPVWKGLMVAVARTRRRDWWELLEGHWNQSGGTAARSQDLGAQWALLTAAMARAAGHWEKAHAALANVASTLPEHAAARDLLAVEAENPTAPPAPLERLWRWLLETAFAPDRYPDFLPKPVLSWMRPIRLAELY